MVEEWKDVKGYEGKYQVSNYGRIRSLDRIISINGGSYIRKGRIIKPLRRNHGYLSAFLSRKQYSIHRLVAEAFIPNPNNLSDVNHIDEDKTNNRADNLEWVTHRQNMRCGTVQKRMSKARINGKQSKAIKQLTLNGQFIREYVSIAEAERQTGFGKGNIVKCAQHSPLYTHAYGYKWEYAT